MALHNRAFGNIVVHSENGRFVVTITAALSALPAMIWNNSSAAASGIATYAISSITISSYLVHRRVTRLSSLLFLASMSSFTISAAVVKRTRFLCHLRQLPADRGQLELLGILTNRRLLNRNRCGAHWITPLTG